MKFNRVCFIGLCSLCALLGDAWALNWNDPNVVPVQSLSDHRWRDAVTGQFINTTGMPANGINPNAAPLVKPTPTTTTSTSAPAATVTTTNTANVPASATVAPNNAGAAPATNGAAPAVVNTPNAAKTGLGTAVKNNWKGMSTKAKVAGGVAVVGGTATVVAATSGNTKHSGWDVVSGVIGGGTAGAGVGSFVPVVGTAVAAGVGAVLGGIITGSQLFSETDCLDDPITGAFTCCHTAFNKGQRQAEIGDYMFCAVNDSNGQPVAYGVRRCLQGDMKKGSETWSDKELSWWDGLWQDDFWEPECQYRFCDEAPLRGLEEYIEYQPDVNNFCWNWVCKAGYIKSGNTCYTSDGNAAGGTPSGTAVVSPNAPGAASTPDPYATAIKNIQAERQRIIDFCGTQNTDTGFGLK